MESDTLQINLAAARVNRGLTQDYVAKKLGVSRTTVIAWEKGKSTPSTLVLNALSDLYGISIDHIFLPR